MVEKIKDYKIIKVVGKGGMGEVYLAIHPTLKREIILKRLGDKSSLSSKRFLQEAKIMLEFRHENIVQFYDHFKEGNSTYIAMEFVKGKALNQIIADNENIPIPIALFITYQIALGLFHAHQKKIIHRDIKPHNILISSSGEVKITDFGIATTSDNSINEIKSDKKEIVGTPAYMAPEQFNKNIEPTNKTDIYSLGVVLQEMITGVRPYKNEFSQELIDNITKGNHAPASRYLKNIPPIVKKILSKTFNPKIKKRYKNLLPLIKLLKNYFKKYNYYEIKDSVKRLVLNDKKINCCSFLGTYEKKQKRSFVFKIVTVSIITVITLTVLFIVTNRFYEWIMPDKYGKIILEFPAKDLDINNTIIRIDGNYYKANLNPEIVLNFDVLLDKKNKKQFIEINNKETFKKSFYIQKGEREVSILSGSYKQIKRIVVLPLTLQKNRKDTREGQNVFIPNIGFWSQEVIFYFRFWDSLKQDRLLFTFNNHLDRDLKKYESENENIMVYTGSGYMKLKNYILAMKKNNENPFISGNTYLFMVSDFSKNDIEYFEKYFKIKISIDERTIIFHQSLTPKPAKIKITSDTVELPIFINKEKQGLLYLKNDYTTAVYKKIKYRKKGGKFYTELLIPPQTLDLKISENGRKIVKYLKSNDELEITVKKEKNKYIVTNQTLSD
jgi:eukaryotic-like serine/threonine-protein kinase